MKILVLNGPNINMTGLREKEFYGSRGYQEVMDGIKAEGEKRGHEMHFFQSNHEGDIIDWLQKMYFEDFDGIIYNPGAHAHYSYAIKDAIVASEKPVVEVHFSNLYARVPAEGAYRKESVMAPVCAGYISGFGEISYHLGIQALESVVARRKAAK